MTRLGMLGIALAFGLECLPAQAQNAERYQLERTDDGYVRMDAETGQMAICRERSGQLMCQMAVEDRDAYEEDMDDLAGKVKALEERIARLEKDLGTRILPTEEEFDRSLGMMEKFFRRFMGVIQDLKRDEPAEPPANRT